jgi:hypothetical protein
MLISRTRGHVVGASRALASLLLAATLCSGNAANAATVFAYGLGSSATNEGFITFDTATPGTRTQIAPTDGASIYGLTFDLAGTTLYGVNDGTKTLETINTGTGARTVVANL